MESTVRLDVINEADGDMLIKFLSMYDKYLVYEEIAEKTGKLHYQGVIHFADIRAFNAAKSRFTTMFGKTHPRSKKSMAQVRKEEYKYYITKDGKLFTSKNYTQDEIDALASKWKSRQNFDVDVKVKSKTSEKFIDVIEDKYAEWILDRKTRGVKYAEMPSREEIQRWIIHTFKTLRKLWDVGVVTKYTNYFDYEANGHKHVDAMILMLRDKY